MRVLGRDGPAITLVGLGGGTIGSASWGPQDDRDALATVRRALERGVNWIDTAADYGASEELIGRILRESGDGGRPYVFTKCGLVPDAANPTRRTRDLSPTSIRRECEASLRRLGIERIDLYQFHWPDENGVAVEDSWGEVMRLVGEGKVRWPGVCNFDQGLLERCHRISPVVSLQLPLSLVCRAEAAALIPCCSAHGIGVLAYRPMQTGILTGRASVARRASLAAGDWRRRSVDWQSPRFDRILAVRDALCPIAERLDVPVSAVAVAWTLAWSGVTATVAGARTPDQVDDWIAAATVKLTAGDLATIAEAIERTGAGDGPAEPGAGP